MRFERLYTDRSGAVCLRAVPRRAGDGADLVTNGFGDALPASIPGAERVVVPSGHLIAQTRVQATTAPMVERLAHIC